MVPHSFQPPDNEAIARALAAYGIRAANDQVAQVRSYMTLLLRWNEKLNITATHDPQEILVRHFCESMYAVASGGIEGGRLADVGSGGGFPGLPIKIIVPALEVSLIEANRKKAVFLAEVVRSLGLTHVQVEAKRYQELGAGAPLDYVCARALGGYDQVLGWASSSAGARTAILWLGAGEVKRAMQITGWGWRKPVTLPQSRGRFLLIGDSLRSV